MKNPIVSALALAVLAAAPLAAQTPDSAFAVSSGGVSLFRVNVDAGAKFGGTYDGDINGSGVPIEGSGTRMMWYPRKAAFRAGGISGTQWDAANIGDYSVAIGQDVRASGSNSTAFGLRSVAAQVSSFAVGEDNTASGAASVAMGYHAHTNARQGSFVFADRSVAGNGEDTLRAGVNNSANWRVNGGFRIFTSTNLLTGVTIQNGTVASNWCNNQTNAVISTSTCAYLSTGGVWTNNSDVNRKHGFAHVDGEDVLLRLRSVPVTTWSYNDEGNAIRHLGPTAQDFYRAFGLGPSATSIPTVDADGVALSAIKALDARTTTQAQTIETQGRTIAAQQHTIEQQGREIAELRARLDRIEAAIAAQAKP
jgi:uncharacterized coiled-coil protein SlyX